MARPGSAEDGVLAHGSAAISPLGSGFGWPKARDLLLGLPLLWLLPPPAEGGHAHGFPSKVLLPRQGRRGTGLCPCGGVFAAERFISSCWWKTA